VENLPALEGAVAEIGLPAVLKTASFGYDGRGQQKLEAASDLSAVWQSFGGQPAVLEAWIPYEKEVSVLVARGSDGEMAVYPVCENLHRHHILDVTKVPANVSRSTGEAAEEIAREIASKLELVGLLAVEMFVLGDGRLLVNELAPRPHNSGHFSFDASVTSQFEQQLRAVCGLPLGSTETLRPCAMVNLLGDVWEKGEPDWAAVAAMGDVKLHLYGKQGARPGRKMGHLVAFGASSDQAAERALAAREALKRK
jgi:5-(carboxyamino)imidazole ribonucleotide synthase